MCLSSVHQVVRCKIVKDLRFWWDCALREEIALINSSLFELLTLSFISLWCKITAVTRRNLGYYCNLVYSWKWDFWMAFLALKQFLGFKEISSSVVFLLALLQVTVILIYTHLGDVGQMFRKLAGPDCDFSLESNSYHNEIDIERNWFLFLG